MRERERECMASLNAVCGCVVQHVYAVVSRATKLCISNCFLFEYCAKNGTKCLNIWIKITKYPWIFLLLWNAMVWWTMNENKSSIQHWVRKVPSTSAFGHKFHTRLGRIWFMEEVGFTYCYVLNLHLTTARLIITERFACLHCLGDTLNGVLTLGINPPMNHDRTHFHHDIYQF